jgi:hypothetical protein
MRQVGEARGGDVALTKVVAVKEVVQGSFGFVVLRIGGNGNSCNHLLV